jgi:hypothetical protein
MEKYFCAAHLRRAGIEVPATAVIEGEAMCAACFKGKAIRPEEEYLGLMNFLPRLDRRKKIRAEHHRDEQPSKCSPNATNAGDRLRRGALSLVRSST